MPPESLWTSDSARSALASALAYERWELREQESLEELVSELSTRFSGVGKVDSTGSPGADNAFGNGPPPGARRVKTLAFTRLAGERDVRFGPFLANGRRPVSDDVQVDLALALVQSAALAQAVDHAFIAEALGHDTVLVRWQAARLLGATKAPKRLFRHAGEDTDPMVRARISFALAE